MIVVISVRQSTVAAISGLHCRALVMVGINIKVTAELQNSKLAERSERLMYEDRVTAIISALVICIIVFACHGLLIITVDNAITKADDNMRTETAWYRSSTTCRCVSVMLPLDANTRRSCFGTGENDALRDDVAAGRRQLHIKAVCQSVREATASGVDNAASPPTGEHH